LINSDQRYQPAPDNLSCIANCSEISPGDNICEGLEGNALQTCRTNNALDHLEQEQRPNQVLPTRTNVYAGVTGLRVVLT
jgi:hypothetical protein